MRIAFLLKFVFTILFSSTNFAMESFTPLLHQEDELFETFLKAKTAIKDTKDKKTLRELRVKAVLAILEATQTGAPKATEYFANNTNEIIFLVKSIDLVAVRKKQTIREIKNLIEEGNKFAQAIAHNIYGVEIIQELPLGTKEAEQLAQSGNKLSIEQGINILRQLISKYESPRNMCSLGTYLVQNPEFKKHENEHIELFTKAAAKNNIKAIINLSSAAVIQNNIENAKLLLNKASILNELIKGENFNLLKDVIEHSLKAIKNTDLAKSNNIPRPSPAMKIFHAEQDRRDNLSSIRLQIKNEDKNTVKYTAFIEALKNLDIQSMPGDTNEVKHDSEDHHSNNASKNCDNKKNNKSKQQNRCKDDQINKKTNKSSFDKDDLFTDDNQVKNTDTIKELVNINVQSENVASDNNQDTNTGISVTQTIENLDIQSEFGDSNEIKHDSEIDVASDSNQDTNTKIFAAQTTTKKAKHRFSEHESIRNRTFAEQKIKSTSEENVSEEDSIFFGQLAHKLGRIKETVNDLLNGKALSEKEIRSIFNKLKIQGSVNTRGSHNNAQIKLDDKRKVNTTIITQHKGSSPFTNSKKLQGIFNQFNIYSAKQLWPDYRF